MKTKSKLLSLLIIILTNLTLMAEESAGVIDAAKFQSLQAALDAVPVGRCLGKTASGQV